MVAFEQPANAFTHSEREAMLESVVNMVKSEVRRAGIVKREREDVIQDCQLLLWEQTAKFDPTRGAKWSTFAMACLRRFLMNWKMKHNAEQMEQVAHIGNHLEFDKMTCDFGQERIGQRGEYEDDDDLGDEAAAALSNAVRRQLAEGILQKLKPSQRRLIEMVAFEGLSLEQVAAQNGHPLKAVRTNLKNALRSLCAKGLSQHAVTDQAIATVTAGNNPQSEEQRRRTRHNGARRAIADRRLKDSLVALCQEPGAKAILAELPVEVAQAVKDVAAGAIRISQASTRLGVSGQKVRRLLNHIVGAIKAESPAVESQVVNEALVVSDRDETAEILRALDTVSVEHGFIGELLGLDTDMRAVVVALLDRSLTVEESAYLLSIDQQELVSHVRELVNAIAKPATHAAQVGRKEHGLPAQIDRGGSIVR